MKQDSSMMRSLTVFYGVVFFVTSVFSDFTALQKNYDASLEHIGQVHHAGLAQYQQHYLATLKRIEGLMQQRGALDELMVVRKEISRFKASQTVPAKPPANTPGLMAKAQRGYRNAAGSREKETIRKTQALMGHYLVHLAALEKKLVQAGQIDAAVIVDREEKKIKRAYVQPPILPALTRRIP